GDAARMGQPRRRVRAGSTPGFRAEEPAAVVQALPLHAPTPGVEIDRFGSSSGTLTGLDWVGLGESHRAIPTERRIVMTAPGDGTPAHRGAVVGPPGGPTGSFRRGSERSSRYMIWLYS